MEDLFFSREKILQTFSTLLGLIEGIRADNIIKPSELRAMTDWVTKNNHLRNRAPFNEIIEIVSEALKDNILTENELEDIKYVCLNFMDNYGPCPKGHLLGFTAGIASDGKLVDTEWQQLKHWIELNRELRGSWPYDEIHSLLTKHLSASSLSPEEHEIIIYYFRDLATLNGNNTLTTPLNEVNKPITGICAVCPEIDFEKKVFCITGESKKSSKKEMADKIHDLGGYYKRDMSSLVDYLVVCSGGSPMWVYSCFGRKVETALAMRKNGHRIQLIHEHDLWDSFEDAA